MVTEYEVYKWLMEAVKLKSRVSSDNEIHVSEVVGCLRKSYYYRRRLLTVSPSNALKLLGDTVHTSLQEVLRKRGFETEFEVGIQLPGFRLVGHVDAYHPDKEVVLEIKTVSSIPEQPYRTHEMQASIYKELTNARHAYIIYISRGDGNIKVFEVNDSKTAIRWAVERARQLHNSLARGEPPAPEANPLCQYCEFRQTCRR